MVRLNVDSAGVERTDATVIATIPAGAGVQGGSCTVRGADGSVLPAQLGRDEQGQRVVQFVVPKLAADKPVTYELNFGDGPASAAVFAFADGDGYRDLTFAGKGVLRYMDKYDPADHLNTFKPYHHVFDFHHPGAFITKGPGGLYTHHRGLFFGFNKTQYGDFWHCPPVKPEEQAKDPSLKPVSQRHDHFVADREFAGPVAARQVSVVNWVGKDGTTPVARDTREVTAWRVSPSKLVLDYVITVEALKDDGLKLAGDPQHAGFHFRAAQEVAGESTGAKGGNAAYVRPKGATLTKNDEWVNTPWVACSFDIQDNRYTVVHLDHPSNPKPTTYSTRGYGRFGAFFVTDVAKDKPLTLTYRVIVLDAKAQPEVNEDTGTALYKDFTTPIKVSAVNAN
jgi:hypothetical protein